MSQTATETFTAEGQAKPRQGWCCGSQKFGWSLLEVATVVGSFVVFWPLGLVAMFLKFKKGELWKGSATGETPWGAFKMPSFKGFNKWTGGVTGFSSSGNAAFDDYKREQLQKLEEMRRKLDDEQRAFHNYMNALRKAKDKEEFDRFMAQHNMPTTL